MRNNRIIWGLLYIVLSSTIAVAQDKVEVKVEKEWHNNGVDGNRSLLSSPSLTKDEVNVYLYWEKALENVTITISDVSGHAVYAETVTIPAGVEHPISIETLPAGQYYISVVQGSNYILGIFTNI